MINRQSPPTKVYTYFKRIVLAIQLIALLVYLYAWIINVKTALSEASMIVIVVCCLMDLCFIGYEKVCAKNSNRI